MDKHTQTKPVLKLLIRSSLVGGEGAYCRHNLVLVHKYEMASA